MNHKKARSLSPSDRSLTWQASLSRLRASATALAGISALILGAPLALHAQGNDAWSTNPADGNFTGINWTTGSTTPGTPPTGTIAAGDNLYFGTSSIVALTNDEATGFSIGSFTFISGASAFTIGGNSFALGVGGITNNSTSLQTINAAFTLAATSTFTTTTGGGNIALGGAISGAGGLTKAGIGALTLTGLETFTGATNVNGGTLVLGSGSGLYNAGTATGAINVNTGGTLQFSRNDAIGGSNVATIPVTVTVNGGTLTTTGFYTSITNANFNGATITDNGGASAGYNAFRLGGTVTIGGTTATNINIGTTATLNGINLGTAGGANDATTFNVADVTASSASDFNVNDIIRNSGGSTNGLTKTGAGTMTLTAANLYTGATNVNAGTLVFSGAGSVYASGTVAGVLNVASGATVRFDGNDALGGSQTVSPVVVTVNGGTLASNGTYTSLSNPVFNAGTLLSNGGPSAGFPGFSIRGTVVVGGSAASNFNVGTGSFNNITLGRFNSSSDIVTFNVADATGNATSDLNVNNVLTNQPNAGAINGLTKIGAGTMTLAGLNTYTGTTTVNAGTLALGVGGGAGAVLGPITVNSGATLNLTATDALGYNTGTTTGTLTVNGGTVNNAVAGNQGFLTNFNLTGSTVTSTGTGPFFFGSTDSSVGITSNASGTTSVISASVIARNSALTFTVAQGTTATGVDLLVTGVVDDYLGNEGIIKAGPGTLVFAANNQYFSPVSVNAGKFLVNGSTRPESVLTVNNSGSVLGGGGTISGAVTINSGSSITGANVGTVGALTLASTVTINGGTYAVDISGATADKLTISGALTLTNANITFTGTPTAASYVLATFASVSGGPFLGTAPSGYTFQFNQAGTELDLVQAVPEPATVLAGVLLVGMMGFSQRRKISAAWAAARGC